MTITGPRGHLQARVPGYGKLRFLDRSGGEEARPLLPAPNEGFVAIAKSGYRPPPPDYTQPAGGQLALWLAARAQFALESPFAAVSPIELRGVLALAPAADFDYLYEHGTCERAVERLLGGSPGSVPDRYRWTDPVRLDLGDVPQVVLVGRHDETWSPPAHSYAREAAARGENVRVVEAPDSGHFEMILPTTSSWPAVLHAFAEAFEEIGAGFVS